jgi:putative oxidoreductase
MYRKLFATNSDFGALLGRVMLGAVMLPHGLQHAVGMFGGYGFSGTLGWMTNTLGFPAPLAALAIATELVAPFALIFGVGGRLAALGIIGIMAGAASTHAPNGFFMNWFGNLPAGSEGFEYHLVGIALAGIIVVNGSGALSGDRLVTTRWTARTPARTRQARPADALNAA